jgi:hypothetical protein
MPRRVGHRHHSPERHTHYDRLFNLQSFAELQHVIRPSVERPEIRGRSVAPAGAPQIQVHQLRDLGQPVEVSLNTEWSIPGPPWIRTMVGLSRILSPSGTSFAPLTSKKSLPSPIFIRMAEHS